MEKDYATRLAIEEVRETLGSVAVTLLCVGEPSKSALRDIRRQVIECIDTIETMMDADDGTCLPQKKIFTQEQSNDHS